MPTGLTTRDSIAVALIFSLYLIMLGGIAIAMTLRGFADWRRRRQWR